MEQTIDVVDTAVQTVPAAQQNGFWGMVLYCVVVFGIIYFGDKLAALAPGNELIIGFIVGVIVAFPFAAINILPQSIISDIIQRDSIENGVNREGIFSAVKTFIEKVASAIAMMGVSSILAIGAIEGESVSLSV